MFSRGFRVLGFRVLEGLGFKVRVQALGVEGSGS